MSKDDVKAQIYQMWRDGLPSTEIAIRLGITRSRVMGCVNRGQRMGLLARRPYNGKKEKPAPKVKLAPLPAPEKKTVTLAVVSIQTKEPDMPKKPAEPPRQQELPLHRAKTITELGSFDCRWIQPDKKYCARPVKSSRTPWCEEHYGMVYVPAPPKKVFRRA